uniref:BrnA antitoxin of type II toxin-antitoxin system n=1 Tax=Candidatus Kentrum sp. FW TaxID=2126338 RepID=A0A450SIA4_9GAMM|nr:MAG: BrnA antitoxin of type II toxin-antitoxin system [Candidatus Kentron sp. FW]VFJ59153.1 MAG: BrnA antitoxin of type II toxin-antitoxin system [Candidatus Kentron sp. FW]
MLLTKCKDTERPYDPNDPATVAAFRTKGKIQLPGQRELQKRSAQVAVTVRYSPEVLGYFKATGKGWQARMNDALREYVEQRKTVTAV